MESCSNDLWLDEEWKASSMRIVFNMKAKFLSSSNTTVKTDQLPKALTTEAVLTICVLLSFLIFSLAGSSKSAFEYFWKINEKKNEKPDRKCTKKVSNSEEKLKGLQHSSDDGLLSKLIQVLKCFCFVANSKKILASTTSKENKISSVNGIRIIFYVWALLVHTSMLYMASIKSIEDQGPYLRSWFPNAALKGDFLNDAFFTLGGFLNALSFFQEYNDKKGNVSWFNFYIKKIVRVTPLYMVILSFYTTLFPYLGSGPFWPTYSTNPICKKIWWMNLLFANNFVKFQNMCMMWTWYLANDFQFYSISPLFMIPLVRWQNLGYILACICIAGSCLSNFFITKAYNLTVELFRVGFHLSDMKGYCYRSSEHANKLSFTSYTRVNSYLVGILLGHYLSRTKERITTKENSAVFLCCGWALIAVCAWYCLFTLGSEEESLIKFAVFNGLRHFLFSCLVSWFIFVCTTGQAEFLNRCLSCHAFVVLSRLSFSGYLTHLLFLEYLALSIRELEEFSVSNVVSRAACVFVLTFIVSFVVSAVIEISVSRLYSLLTSKRKKE